MDARVQAFVMGTALVVLLPVRPLAHTHHYIGIDNSMALEQAEHALRGQHGGSFVPGTGGAVIGDAAPTRFGGDRTELTRCVSEITQLHTL